MKPVPRSGNLVDGTKTVHAAQVGVVSSIVVVILCILLLLPLQTMKESFVCATIVKCVVGVMYVIIGVQKRSGCSETGQEHSEYAHLCWQRDLARESGR